MVLDNLLGQGLGVGNGGGLGGAEEVREEGILELRVESILSAGDGCGEGAQRELMPGQGGDVSGGGREGRPCDLDGRCSSLGVEVSKGVSIRKAWSGAHKRTHCEESGSDQRGMRRCRQRCICMSPRFFLAFRCLTQRRAHRRRRTGVRASRTGESGAWGKPRTAPRYQLKCRGCDWLERPPIAGTVLTNRIWWESVLPAVSGCLSGVDAI